MRKEATIQFRCEDRERQLYESALKSAKRREPTLCLADWVRRACGLAAVSELGAALPNDALVPKQNGVEVHGLPLAPEDTPPVGQG
jgi:hypothetical protein